MKKLKYNYPIGDNVPFIPESEKQSFEKQNDEVMKERIKDLDENKCFYNVVVRESGTTILLEAKLMEPV